ncbi:23S rRNA (pseudouridine(1915)-N(3))-methyltransferase RlmH [Neomoorella humiferrea]|uniref:Ribosomal RNA large subunit methyltransferase H n=1 Tax=Neomoorella humiferrea TaxID=676965 RepID=A0A2T0AL05_9FIRM|nr:23S rRNA (pseudouridine(1915)-N(3))-methyltransferase RlmH [Moorella humiferrea]PRR69288.1 Ribosomal RNA large subunit methyltransferase H [Moorella humiferrea]
MQHIDIIAVGRLREPFLRDGVSEYLKRLRPFARVRILEGPEEKIPEPLPPTRARQILAAEGEGIMRLIRPGAYIIALDREGTMLTSEELAGRLGDLALTGRSNLTFIIGGTLGLDPGVLEAAHLRLSFSRLTFPHQLMRLILLEQLYRAFKILSGEPYHR